MVEYWMKRLKELLAGSFKMLFLVPKNDTVLAYFSFRNNEGGLKFQQRDLNISTSWLLSKFESFASDLMCMNICIHTSLTHHRRASTPRGKVNASHSWHQLVQLWRWSKWSVGECAAGESGLWTEKGRFFFHKAQFLLGSKTTNLMHKEQATIYQLWDKNKEATNNWPFCEFFCCNILTWVSELECSHQEVHE